MKIISKKKLENKTAWAEEVFKKTGLDIEAFPKLNNNENSWKRRADIFKAFQYWEKLRMRILPEQPKRILSNFYYLPKTTREMFDFAGHCHFQYS